MPAHTVKAHILPTWMIVGALSDLGRAVAWQMAQEGIQLILVDQHQDELFTLADEFEAKGLTTPLLVAIDLANLELGSQQLTDQLAQLKLTLDGWVWTGYHLKSPTPMLHISLTDWQTELTNNLTYPYWILRTCIHGQTMRPSTQIWFALPEAQSFTHAMGLSSSVWAVWLTQLSQEWGDDLPHPQLWYLPQVADRIHRRIWPLAQLNDFHNLDVVVKNWLVQIGYRSN